MANTGSHHTPQFSNLAVQAGLQQSLNHILHFFVLLPNGISFSCLSVDMAIIVSTCGELDRRCSISFVGSQVILF